MYRLLKYNTFQLPTVRGMSPSNNVEISNLNVGEKICDLCHKTNYVLKDFVRHKATHTDIYDVPKKPRKKRMKTKKTYAELLMVSEQSHSECKVTVHKLKPEDLRMLALTNLKLSELYKLKEIYRNNKHIGAFTYNNLSADLPILNKVDVNLPAIPPIEDQEHLISSTLEVVESLTAHNPDLLDKPDENCDNSFNVESILETEIVKVKKEDTFKPEVEIDEHVEELTEIEPEQVEAVVKNEQKKGRQFDPRMKQEIANKTLAAYIEICCNLRMVNRGYNALNYHRFKAERHNATGCPPINNINVYNALLKGYGLSGDVAKVEEIMKLIKEDKLRPNLQTFVSIFECIGRTTFLDSALKNMRIYTKLMNQENITFDEIMTHGTFLNDQRAKVLAAMKLFNPSYVPKFMDPNIQYENHLVDALNHEDQIGISTNIVKDSPSNATVDLEQIIKDQLNIEKHGYVTVKSVEARGKPSADVLKYREVLASQLTQWEETALKAFNRDLFALASRRSALNLEPFFRAIPPKDFVNIIIEEAVKLAQGSETYSPTVNQLYRDLGNKVYLRYKVLTKQKTGALDKIIRIHKKFCQDHLNFNYDLDVLPTDINNINSRQRWQWIEHTFKPTGCTITTDHQEWVPTVLINVGKFLYRIIMFDLKIDVNSMKFNIKHKNYLPAFYTIFRHQGRIVKEEVKPHPILSKLYRASVPETLTFPANEVPMKCPSIPWISPNVGGYLISPCDVMRLPHQAATQKERLQTAKLNDLYPSLDALNQLSTIPWRVNQRILDVILEVFSKGGSDKLDVPEHPSNLPLPQPITSEMDKTEKFQRFKAKLQYRRKKAEMYSLWCDCLYRLSLANHFRDQVFWLPHNMDFRGRVYPVPPHLNYQGSDLARSMLVFAESRPLGPEGLNWLKLHLINLTGLKKRDSVQERLIYANEIIDKILDCADNPLTGCMWWVDSDEPWQTLACCMEIANAVRSPNPEEYRTHFPIHQDGSCNGLQHYAALGRDSAGAFSVNLAPADVPQDVYSAVATLVEEKRKEDAENGLQIAQTLEGFVKRKVIKQTVMTTVYGVTRYGARLQIAKQLKDIDSFPKDSVWAASTYLTAKTFDSLRTMFTSTKEIQDWFTECARLISSVGGQNVEWITPLGLPVVQPYSKYKTLPFNKVYEQYHMDKYEKPNVMKHKNAFPPNFIHSLDSTHMMLTSLYCERAGINFVSVHDCYWTHPSTVHIMNKICREQFVALHSEPILENLSVFLTEKYSYNDSEFTNDGSVTDLTKRKLNKVLRKLPPTGRFDINEVLKSIYFFS